MTTSSDQSIRVTGTGIDLGSSLIETAQGRVAALAGRASGRLTLASVTFEREAGAYTCAIRMKFGATPDLHALGQDRDIRRALAQAVQRMAEQIQRQKGVRRDRGGRTGATEVLTRAGTSVPVRRPTDDLSRFLRARRANENDATLAAAE